MLNTGIIKVELIYYSAAMTGIAIGLWDDIVNGWAKAVLVNIVDGMAIGLACIGDAIEICSDWIVGIVIDVLVETDIVFIGELRVAGKDWIVVIGCSFLLKKELLVKVVDIGFLVLYLEE